MKDGQDTNDFELLEDLIKNHGFPSFQEFSKNPDKWRANKEDIFESIQNGSTAYKLGKVRYFWRGQFEGSLEKIQRIATEEGYEGNELEMEPISKEKISLDPMKIYDVDVNIWPKHEMKAQGKVVADGT